MLFLMLNKGDEMYAKAKLLTQNPARAAESLIRESAHMKRLS